MASPIAVLGDRSGKRGGLLGQPLTRGEQAATDQQHRVRTIEVKYLGRALERHAAGGYRHAGSDAVPWPARLFGEAPAGVRRITETSAVIRKDHRVGAEYAEQLTDQQVRCDARRAAHG